MSFSIRAIIRAFVAPNHHLSCTTRIWQAGLAELWKRGEGYHESGAFLLGIRTGMRRRVERFVYYDDLDPDCLKAGIVVFDGAYYGRLWELCRELRLEVVADVHTHPGGVCQSMSDRQNPMIAVPGHIAIIVPNLARQAVSARELGIYEYLGNHWWHDHTGILAQRFFYIGRWG